MEGTSETDENGTRMRREEQRVQSTGDGARTRTTRQRRTSSTAFVLLLFVFSAIIGTGRTSDDFPITRNFKCRLNGCCDQHEWCRFWASVGECRTNKGWMDSNCQLACNSCHRPPVRRPFTFVPGHRPPPPRRPVPPPVTTTTRRFVALPPPVTSTTPRPPPPPPPPPTTTTRLTPRPPPPPPPPIITTAPFPTVTSRSPLQRCKQIQADPSNAAEVLLRERLVSATEDNSGRRTLSQEQVVRSNIANACVPRLDEAECERSLCYNLFFRTMDGTCNNFRSPLRGAAFRPYSRLLPPEYDNGLSEPISSIRSTLRPNPREINLNQVTINEFNALLMQFGQFISHDLAKTTLVPSAKCNVCQNITSRCMSVQLSPNDPNAHFKADGCLRVSRSSPICGSGKTKPRQQLNENTGFIDGSPIYGSSVGDLRKFREGSTGLLKMNTFNGMRLLPFDSSQCHSSGDCSAIFIAGDSRVNLFLGLTSFHLMFTREHNRIASRLQQLNPNWNGDRIFQESRKIVGAIIQAICYREYLPKVLGSSFAATIGPYRGYDANIDPTIANEFTSQAYRFGHGMIQEFYPRLDSAGRTIPSGGFAFVDGTLHSDHFIFQGGPDPIIRGMMSQQLKRPQRLTRTVTEQLFGTTDLGTINIQRGRDHGVPSYMRFRQLCGLSTATTFDQLSREIMSSEVRTNLQRIYGTPDRMDLFVGGLLEDPVVRGLVGPTVACIIGPQFARTRDGDRLYFENPGIFSRAQLAEIRRSSLARVICDNADDIRTVPREAFRTGPIVPCAEIPQMDLSKWKE
uniref:peroxidase n=1 Tax=Globodera pallida TaxID=36090 RepID=A0A183CF97_GLOPA